LLSINDLWKPGFRKSLAVKDLSQVPVHKKTPQAVPVSWNSYLRGFGEKVLQPFDSHRSESFETEIFVDIVGILFCVVDPRYLSLAVLLGELVFGDILDCLLDMNFPNDIA
jgi:hypothetical protein